MYERTVVQYVFIILYAAFLHVPQKNVNFSKYETKYSPMSSDSKIKLLKF